MSAPDDLPSPETAAETRRAIRLLGAVVGVALALWAALGLVVTRESTLSAWGRSELDDELVARGGRRMYWAQHEALTFDRDAVYGDRPVVWILGSSITREAFDAEVLEQQLRSRGLDVGVRKYAFDRGAPLFTWGLLDALELRPGDRVITTVSIDNFRRDWLAYYGGFHVYLNTLLDPAEVMQVASLPLADRLDYALAAAPPGEVQRVLPQFRDGLEGWIRWQTGRAEHPPSIDPPRPFSYRAQVRGFRELARFEKNELGADDLQLAEGQVHWDALARWHAEVREAGAEPWVLYLPPSPEYHDRFLPPGFDEEVFHAAMAEAFPPYVRMSPLPQDHYTDYKHLNNDGRPVITSQLARLLARTPPGEAPGAPPRAVPRRPREMDFYRKLDPDPVERERRRQGGKAERNRQRRMRAGD